MKSGVRFSMNALIASVISFVVKLKVWAVPSWSNASVSEFEKDLLRSALLMASALGGPAAAFSAI